MCINIIIWAVTDHGSVKVGGVGKATRLYTHTHTYPGLTFSFHSGARSVQPPPRMTISGADS